MKSRIASVLVVATLLAGAALAAPIGDRETITLDRAAIVGASILPPGTYRIDLAAGPDTARFVQGKRTVAEARCTVGLAQVIYPGNAVHYRPGDGGQDRLVKVVFSRSKLAIEFPTDPAGASDAPIAKAADRP